MIESHYTGDMALQVYRTQVCDWSQEPVRHRTLLPLILLSWRWLTHKHRNKSAVTIRRIATTTTTMTT